MITKPQALQCKLGFRWSGTKITFVQLDVERTNRKFFYIHFLKGDHSGIGEELCPENFDYWDLWISSLQKCYSFLDSVFSGGFLGWKSAKSPRSVAPAWFFIVTVIVSYRTNLAFSSQFWCFQPKRYIFGNVTSTADLFDSHSVQFQPMLIYRSDTSSIQTHKRENRWKKLSELPIVPSARITYSEDSLAWKYSFWEFNPSAMFLMRVPRAKL